MKRGSLKHEGDGGGRDAVVTIPDLRRDRSGTLRLMSWWVQERVQQARILVVGAGAIGNEVIKNLALMGVGHLFVVDRDVVEMANLSRSILFRERDQGRRKVAVAAERVKELNPGVRIEAIHGDVTIDVGLGVFRRMDVVIGCLDSRHARLAVNNACWLAGAPWVDGAIEDMFGEVRVFVPGHGACYACTLTELDWQILREARSCRGIDMANILEGKVPTTPTIASIIGAIQSQEALKFIHGMASHPGKAFVFRGLALEGDLLTLQEKQECQSHYTLPEIVQLEGARAATTTFRELLGLARVRLGDDAYLYLRDREMVSHLDCPACGERREVGILEGKMDRAELQCPACRHDTREPELTHVFTGSEPFADFTLARSGIPPLDIIEARSSRGAVGLELTGDESAVMGNG